MSNIWSNRGASAYQRVNVETSMHTIDQHQLVSLLFTGALEAIVAARGALARGDVLAKCNAIGKAISILQEGLIAGLDPIDGGELAANLSDLYDYCIRRLILANARNDDAMLKEVLALLEPVAEGWNEIRKTTPPDPGVARPTVSIASSARLVTAGG